MKGIRYYYTACLPPAYRKGGRSSSLIGSQFFGRRGMEEVGWRRPVRLWAARAHGLALSVEAEEDRGSISLPRPWARTKEPPPICLPPSMPKEVQKRSAVPTFSYGGKSREAREYRLAYIGAPSHRRPEVFLGGEKLPGSCMQRATVIPRASFAAPKPAGASLRGGGREGCGRFFMHILAMERRY